MNTEIKSRLRAQTELAGADDNPIFPALENFFTIAFTSELAVNAFANFFTPFFQVRRGQHTRWAASCGPRSATCADNSGRRRPALRDPSGSVPQAHGTLSCE